MGGFDSTREEETLGGGVDCWKEKIIQEGWKGKSNQVRNRINSSPGHPPQGTISL